ncbi:UNVERIFIED_CONTAM: hypothetical protein FKN15_057628 [Acipenser sinensis]
MCRQLSASFHSAAPPCSYLRATASEDHAALGCLQGPSESTGVAGARPAMQLPQSYSIGGPRSSGQLAGAQRVYVGC